MPLLRIAQAQINLKVGDLAGNAKIIIDYMERARRLGADLVTFPELAVTGYPPEDLLLKPRFLKDAAKSLEEVASAAQGITAWVGCAHAVEDKVYNAAALLHQGQVADYYHKIELPNYGVFDEVRYFAAGRTCHFLELNGVRLLLSICEDIWVEDGPVERCAKNPRTQVVINISGSPFFAGKLALRQAIVTNFARRTGSQVFYNNLVGGQDELIFDGGSLVVTPGGRVCAQAKRFVSDLLVYDLELPAVQDSQLPETMHLTRIASQAPAQRPPVQAGIAPAMGLVEEIYHALVLGIRDYLAKTGFKKVVLGLSGGIDSALTACLAVEALGQENVTGVTMPSQYTSQGTLGDAELLARNLGIKIHTVPIKAILDGYLAELKPDLGGEDLGVTAENLQARIRGNILMAFSNRYGWLVLTTGNKSELAVGYCTLYGDMAGGFAVIKDVPKTMVYQLAEFVNQRAGRELIPASTIQRAPSAELRPDQTDQDSLPPYEVLDPILKAYVEEDMVFDEIVEMGFAPELVKDVVRMVDLNEYKRRQSPPGVKITPKAFGKDRRLPICNHYHPGWS
jgi:NAD+ synthase (glutamine-hydrolysing)